MDSEGGGGVGGGRAIGGGDFDGCVATSKADRA